MAKNFSVFAKKQTSKIVDGINPEEDFNALISQLKQNKITFDSKKLRKAFDIVIDSNKNYLHINGLPRYTQPLSVAMILAKEIPADEDSIIAALFFNLWKTTDKYDYEYIKNEFGGSVVLIVDSLNKIYDIDNNSLTNPEKLENFRKFLIAVVTDYRVILIKLAAVLENMRNVQHYERDEQIRMAYEVLEIYNPFANRLGLRNLKWELDDLAFKIINTKEYNEIADYLQASREQREEYIRVFIEPLKEKLQNDEFLKKNKIIFEINGRAKHIYSIYHKLLLRQKSIDELYDLFAIRVIVNTTDPMMCYYVYGLLASVYPPVPETFKDYIGIPKKNGYQSIHSAVFGPDNKAVEIQIRTEGMHLFSEQGVAAHFNYKSNIPKSSILEKVEINKWMEMVRLIFEKDGNVNPNQIMDEVKSNLFSEEIYIYSPTNDFINLPINSTTLDYAYKIHTEIGDHYVAAKVNGKIVSIDYKLKNGDKVEIINSNNAKPSEDWLEIVVSSKAKSHLTKYFKEKRKEQQRIGKQKWEKVIDSYNIKINESQIIDNLKEFHIDRIGDFYESIADESIDIDKLVSYFNNKLYNQEVDQFSSYSNKQKILNTLNLVDKIDENIDNHEEILPNEDSYTFSFYAKDNYKLIDRIKHIFSKHPNLLITSLRYDMNFGKIEGELTFKSDNKNDAIKLMEDIEGLTEIIKKERNLSESKANINE